MTATTKAPRQREAPWPSAEQHDTRRGPRHSCPPPARRRGGAALALPRWRCQVHFPRAPRDPFPEDRTRHAAGIPERGRVRKKKCVVTKRQSGHAREKESPHRVSLWVVFSWITGSVCAGKTSLLEASGFRPCFFVFFFMLAAYNNGHRGSVVWTLALSRYILASTPCSNRVAAAGVLPRHWGARVAIIPPFSESIHLVNGVASRALMPLCC